MLTWPGPVLILSSHPRRKTSNRKSNARTNISLYMVHYLLTTLYQKIFQLHFIISVDPHNRSFFVLTTMKSLQTVNTLPITFWTLHEHANSNRGKKGTPDAATELLLRKRVHIKVIA